MVTAESVSDGRQGRAIPAWRIVAGAYLHCVVPAYALALPLSAILVSPANTPVAAMVACVPRLSGWFLGGYALLAAVSVAAAMAIEPVLRNRAAQREARDPQRAALASRQRVARAIADGTPGLGPEVARLLDLLRGPRWDHADDRFQALSTDLAEVVRTSSAALASASSERRAAILDVAAASLRRIEAALVALEAERSRLDEGDLHTVARYVATRYGPSDFAGDDS